MATIIAFVLVGIGVIALVLRRDLVIKLLALGLVNSGVILFLVSIGDRPGGRIPIYLADDIQSIVDPLPQALVLSAIVVNFAILALALVFVMLLAERYHTTDAERIAREISLESDDEERPCR